jgi:hypothetical protein
MGRQLQCKLEIGPVDDPLEQEADRMADVVMRMPQAAVSLAANPGIHRKCDDCLEEEKSNKTVFTKRDGTPAGQPGEVPAAVYGVLDPPGEALVPAARRFFEPCFGRSLKDIRIHRDSQANDSARAVDALAYTMGHHIVFARDRFDPVSDQGRHLLAHELTHTVQQSGDAARPIPPLAAPPP